VPTAGASRRPASTGAADLLLDTLDVAGAGLRDDDPVEPGDPPEHPARVKVTTAAAPARRVVPFGRLIADPLARTAVP
jgi:hypothetical protein